MTAGATCNIGPHATFFFTFPVTNSKSIGQEVQEKPLQLDLHKVHDGIFVQQVKRNRTIHYTSQTSLYLNKVPIRDPKESYRPPYHNDKTLFVTTPSSNEKWTIQICVYQDLKSNNCTKILYTVVETYDLDF